MAPKKPHIGVKEEACDYLIYNQNILNGYRINYCTWGVTFKSMFQLHNETVNVWTHFVGFLVCFVAFLVVTFSKVMDDPAYLSENAKHLMYLVQGGESDGAVTAP